MPWIGSACSVVRLQAARCLIPSDTEGVCHAHSHRPECQRAGAFVMSPRWEARRMDVRDLPPVSDDEIVGMWRIAADNAASHKASAL